MPEPRQTPVREAPALLAVPTDDRDAALTAARVAMDAPAFRPAIIREIQRRMPSDASGIASAVERVLKRTFAVDVAAVQVVVTWDADRHEYLIDARLREVN